MIDLPSEASWLATRIRPFASGMYEPDEHGMLARLIPIETAGGLVTDIVAYAADDPFIWWTRCGRGRLLGERALTLAIEHNRPVLLRPTPHAWLSEFEAFAVCVLRRSERAALLKGVRVIGDPAHVFP